jgi:VWFA-related protein
MPELRVSRKLLPCLLQLCSLVPAGVLSAQTQTEEVRVSSRSYIPGLPPNDPSLVQVAVVVRDSQGHAVPGLQAASFQIWDQGREASVAGLVPVNRSQQEKLPRNIAICFDDYGATPANLQRAKLMASRFIQEGIAPNDMVSIASTYHKEIVPFTSDKIKLQGAIDRIQQQATPAVGAPQIPRNNQIPGSARGGAAIFTAEASSGFAQTYTAQSILSLVNSYANGMSRRPGNRSILLLSPGFNGTPDREMDQTISQAVAAGVVVNVVDSKSSFREAPASAERAFLLPAASYTTEPGGLGIEADMASLARGTGGLFFHQNDDPLSRGFREFGAVPEISYVLAVSPGADQRFHRLKVLLSSRQPFALETRNGYFPPKGVADNRDPLPRPSRARLDQQVMAMSLAADFPVSAGIQYNKPASGNTGIRVTLHLDIKPLQFEEVADRHSQKLTLVAAVIDANGNLVSAKEGVMDLALSEAKYKSMLDSGVNLTLNLEAPAGSYRLSTVALDAQGKMASTLNAIQVP